MISLKEYNPYPLFSSVVLKDGQTLIGLLGFESASQLEFRRDYSFSVAMELINARYGDAFWHHFNSVKKCGEGLLKLHETLARLIAERNRLISLDRFESQRPMVDIGNQIPESSQDDSMSITISAQADFFVKRAMSFSFDLNVPGNFMSMSEREKRLAIATRLKNASIPSKKKLFINPDNAIWQSDQDRIDIDSIRQFSQNGDYLGNFNNYETSEYVSGFLRRIFHNTEGLNVYHPLDTTLLPDDVVEEVGEEYESLRDDFFSETQPDDEADITDEESDEESDEELNETDLY